jgi:hypothetical protein
MGNEVSPVSAEPERAPSTAATPATDFPRAAGPQPQSAPGDAAQPLRGRPAGGTGQPDGPHPDPRDHDDSDTDTADPSNVDG